MSKAYRVQGLAFAGRRTRDNRKGNIHHWLMLLTMERSLTLSDTHVRMRRLTANRNWDGIASKFAWKTENPSFRRM